MAGRKVFIQMGGSKTAKSGKRRRSVFAGAMRGKSAEEIASRAVAETRKAAEGGDARACYLMGLAYAEGSGVRQNAEESFQWFARAADLGLPEAQCQAAAMCHTGSGCPQDSVRAAAWWRSAAEQDEPLAMCCYGLALFRGDGVVRDKLQGFNLLRRAAKLGVPEAAAVLRTAEMIEFAMQC